MERTKLIDRRLPDYTRGEEIFNMVSHIVGGALGVAALVLCVVVSAIKRDPMAVVSSAVYGASLIMLYTMSSVYHGLKCEMAKKVMQVLDHCTIYFLIAGTYTPILLCSIIKVSPLAAWGIFSLVWGFAALATTLTAIDLKKYSKFSMICYIGMGWCILLAAKTTMEAMALEGIILLLSGGVAYTVGAVIYGLGKRHRYMHSVFHLFVVLGSLLQFFCILFYVI
jgi:hemolysin III